MKGTFDYSLFSPSDAAFLRETAGQVRALVRKATPIVIQIGDRLAAAKERLPHGQFGPYCVDEAGIPIRSAENYMSLAELAKVYPPSLLARLPATAGYKLAENTTPAAVVAAVMSEVAAGRRFKVHEVKRRLAAAKPAESPVLPRRWIALLTGCSMHLIPRTSLRLWRFCGRHRSR